MYVIVCEIVICVSKDRMNGTVLVLCDQSSFILTLNEGSCPFIAVYDGGKVGRMTLAYTTTEHNVFSKQVEFRVKKEQTSIGSFTRMPIITDR